MKNRISFFKHGDNSITPVERQCHATTWTVDERIRCVQKSLPNKQESIVARNLPVHNYHHIPLYTRDYLRKKVREARIQNDSIDSYLNQLPDSKKAVSYMQLYYFIMHILEECQGSYNKLLEHPLINILFKHTNLIEAFVCLRQFTLLDRSNFHRLYLLTEKEKTELCAFFSRNKTELRNPVTRTQIELLKKIFPYHQPWLHDSIDLLTKTTHSLGSDIIAYLSLSQQNRKALHAILIDLLNKNTMTLDQYRLSYLKIAKKLNQAILEVLKQMPFNHELALELVRTGGNPDIANEVGETILHRFTQHILFNRAPDFCIAAIIELVYERGANINRENSLGQSPWDLLMSKRHPDQVQYAMVFLELGANYKKVLYPEYRSYLDFLRSIRTTNQDADELLSVLSKKFNALQTDYGIPDYLRIKRNTIRKLALIGEGGYGKVYKARMGQFIIAVKRTPISNYEDFIQELTIMHRLQSDYKSNIIQLEGYDINIRNGYCYIYMELAQCSLQDLYDYQSPWSIKERYRLMKNIVDGICYMHAHNFIHADIKSNNVLIDKHYQARIADFGLSRTPGNFDTPFGTGIYMAPELINKALNTMASDIYSLALTLYEVISWAFIFTLMQRSDDESIQELRNDVKSGFRPPIDGLCPKKAARLITWGWSQKPEDRPDASQLSLALENRY